MSADRGDTEFVESAHDREVADLVAGQLDVGSAKNERLVALVRPAVDESRRLGIGSGDDDTGHPHDVELETRRVEPIDLFVLGDEHLAALVAAFLDARLLVLDVVTGNADFDEAADEVADVRVSAVTRVGVGDDERPEVDLRRRPALRFRHPRTQEVLVPVGGEQRPDDRGGLVRHLAQGIAGQVGTGILRDAIPSRKWPSRPSRCLRSRAAS